MNDKRVLPLLRSRWDRGLLAMVAWSLALHVAVIAGVVVIMSRSRGQPSMASTSYTVELSDLAVLGKQGQNLTPGASRKKLSPTRAKARGKERVAARPRTAAPKPPATRQAARPKPVAAPKPPATRQAARPKPVAAPPVGSPRKTKGPAPTKPPVPAPAKAPGAGAERDVAAKTTAPSPMDTAKTETGAVATGQQEAVTPAQSPDVAQPPKNKKDTSPGEIAAATSESVKPSGAPATKAEARAQPKSTDAKEKPKIQGDEAPEKKTVASSTKVAAKPAAVEASQVARDDGAPKKASPEAAAAAPSDPATKPAATKQAPSAEAKDTASAASPTVVGQEPEADEADGDERYAAAIERIRDRVGQQEGGLGGAGDPAKPPSVGGTGGGAGNEVVGAEFLIYYNVLISSIRQAWIWAGHNDDLTVRVRFEVTPEGEIRNIRLQQPSGDAAYDQSVLRAIEDANPLPPPPVAHRRDFRDVELTFRPGDFRQPSSDLSWTLRRYAAAWQAHRVPRTTVAVFLPSLRCLAGAHSV